MTESKNTARETELLAATEVAELIGIKQTTVYRWCSEGKLPCLKIGKHWRIRREVLEDFLKESGRPRTLLGQLDSFLRVPESVLGRPNVEILHRLDAAFFRVGEAWRGLLVKFYAGEEHSEEELLLDFEQNGLEAGRLKRQGRLLMRAEEEPSSGSRWRQLGQLIEEKGGVEGRTVWASFDWVKPVQLETALEQQRQLSELVDASQLVVKTAAIEEAIEEWRASQLRRVQSMHSAMILASEEQLLLAHATPMPPS